MRSFIVLAAMAVSSATALATVTYSFQNVTANSVANAASGQAQLSVDVAPVGLNQVSFTFFNAGPAAMSITDVYFDDGTLLGIASITNGPGVNFSQGASPPNLPGGNLLTPAFNTTAGFFADSDPPAQPNGVNPGEQLTIVFDLINGQTFNDTINALNTPGDYLRIGIHVQGFADGGSESFVNNVPAPGMLALAGAGGLFAARRKRSR
jgi:MYXO-CTERM domain-containing protein